MQLESHESQVIFNCFILDWRTARKFECEGAPVGRELPAFTRVRVDDSWAHASVSALHAALTQGASLLEREARLHTTLAQLMGRYGEVGARLPANARQFRRPAAISTSVTRRACTWPTWPRTFR